ncbi:MAG: signal peptidase I [Deltaproteobacteria bacterium]|nr:signal peptidase I [Deltaproteobacteria bacterium]
MDKRGKRSKHEAALVVPESAWQRLVQWRRHRRTRKEAKHVLKTANKLERRYGKRWSAEIREDFTRGKTEVETALAGNRLDEMRNAAEVLDGVIDAHLKKERRRLSTRENIEALAIAVLIALILRAFVIEAFKIPSGSMIPTLEVGDHIFVNKFVYGLRIPFTSNPPKKFWASNPKRGDVIVFVYPVNPDQDFIKRVIAIEGDKIRVRNHTVFLTRAGTGKEEEIKRKPVGALKYCNFSGDESGSAGDRWPWDLETKTLYEETIDGTTFHTLSADSEPDGDETVYEKTIPPGSVFVMGDHRDNSKDSREWGFVDIQNIKGKALFVWFSSGASTNNGCQDVSFWENFSKWVRWGRFFGAVE